MNIHDSSEHPRHHRAGTATVDGAVDLSAALRHFADRALACWEGTDADDAAAAMHRAADALESTAQESALAADGELMSRLDGNRADPSLLVPRDRSGGAR